MSILMSSGAPWCALLLACALGTSTPGSAQPTPPTAVTALDPIVVTAARMPQPIVQVLADVTVIGQDEILRRMAALAAPPVHTCAGPILGRRWC